MEQQKKEKQKTGCGKALFVFIGIYGLLVLVYYGLSPESRESADAILDALGIIFVGILLFAAYSSYK